MKTKLAALSVLLLFGWALVRTGNVGQIDRWKRPEPKATLRQVEVVATTSKYRLVKHAMGKTQVPLHPKRIASLCGAATDSLVALGVRPILVQSGTGIDGAQLYLADQLKGIAVMPRGSVMSLETVLAAKPDLIFASSMPGSKLYGQLSKIAPTVMIGSMGDGFRENRILDVGEALGMRKEAQRRLADFRRHVDEAKASLTQTNGQPVAFLRFRRNTCVIYTRTAMFGPLLFEQLGLTPDPAMPMAMSSGGWDVLSLERMSELQAEHIFVTIDPDSQLYFDSIAQTPLWRNIPAALDNHVHCVASSTWLGGDGLLGCEAIVADVLAAMIPEQSP